MLWKEILAGFVIAGFVALLPQDFFNALFITESGGALQLLENVIVGPIVAALSFVCSVGNIPLAAVLWAGGISFSGVLAFVYADLIVIPIVLAYRKYYGGKVTALLVGIMFVTMVAAALIVDGIFTALGLVPTDRPSIESISEREITWNYTTVLNILFTFVAAALIALTMRPRRAHGRARRPPRPPPLDFGRGRIRNSRRREDGDRSGDDPIDPGERGDHEHPPSDEPGRGRIRRRDLRRRAARDRRESQRPRSGTRGTRRPAQQRLTHSSVPARRRLTRERRRFSSSRRSTDACDGFVGLRLRGTRSASRSWPTSRSSASSRFRA